MYQEKLDFKCIKSYIFWCYFTSEDNSALTRAILKLTNLQIMPWQFREYNLEL